MTEILHEGPQGTRPEPDWLKLYHPTGFEKPEERTPDAQQPRTEPPDHIVKAAAAAVRNLELSGIEIDKNETLTSWFGHDEITPTREQRKRHLGE